MEHTSEQVPTVFQESASRWSSRPQFSAIGAAGIILLSAGMNFALSVGWFQYSLVGSLQHFCYSWFIGVIIGTTASIPLLYTATTKMIRAISSVLICIGGIAFSSCPHMCEVILAGRYINGIAVGIGVVPFIMYATDLADDSCRGSCLALEQCCLACGIAIQMICTSYWSSDVDFAVNRLHGILDIIFGLLAAVSLKYYVVSPMVHLRKGDDAAALDALAHLHRPSRVTEETQILLVKRKTYIQEQESLTMSQSIGESLGPLFKMLLVRSTILALSNSLTLNTAFHYSMSAKSVTWVPVATAFCRIAGSLVTLGVVDTVGRKLPSLIFAVCIASLCLNHSKLFYNIYDIYDLAIAKYWYMVIQFFVGLYAPYTTVYMTEAFSLRVKPFMMAICVVIEQVLHIILICITKDLIAQNLSAQGGIVFGACFILVFTIPAETRNTQLSEAQLKFRKFWHINVR